MSRSTGINVIDVGTSKVTCLLTKPSSDSDNINVVGVATLPSRGMGRSRNNAGTIVNIEEVVGSVTDCIEAAERMAGYNINSALVSISGSHIKSQNSQGVVAVTEPEGEISSEDIYRAIEAARAVSLPSSREIMHVLPREFAVDSQKGIKDPIGMSGIRLETEAHIITGSTTAIKNTTKAVSEIGVNVQTAVYSGLASSLSTLTDTEKELGVVSVDIGAGVTNVTAYVDSACSYSAVIPLGARKITDDLALGLMISLDSAEKIKHHISVVSKTKGEIGKSDEINLAKIGVREEVKNVSKKTLSEGIVRPRLNEIFTMVGGVIRKSGYAGQMPAGVVLSGGGSLTIGVVESCKRVLQLPVRLGSPTGLSGLTEEISSPEYATAVGLVLYGYQSQESSGGGQSSFKIDNVLKKLPLKQVSKKATDFFKSLMP
jgi:cell division protein FtsA